METENKHVENSCRLRNGELLTGPDNYVLENRPFDSVHEISLIAVRVLSRRGATAQCQAYLRRAVSPTTELEQKSVHTDKYGHSWKHTGIGIELLSLRAMAFFTSWFVAVAATYSIRSRLRITPRSAKDTSEDTYSARDVQKGAECHGLVRYGLVGKCTDRCGERLTLRTGFNEVVVGVVSEISV